MSLNTLSSVYNITLHVLTGNLAKHHPLISSNQLLTHFSLQNSPLPLLKLSKLQLVHQPLIKLQILLYLNVKSPTVSFNSFFFLFHPWKSSLSPMSSSVSKTTSFFQTHSWITQRLFQFLLLFQLPLCEYLIPHLRCLLYFIILTICLYFHLLQFHFNIIQFILYSF